MKTENSESPDTLEANLSPLGGSIVSQTVPNVSSIPSDGNSVLDLSTRTRLCEKPQETCSLADKLSSDAKWSGDLQGGTSSKSQMTSFFPGDFHFGPTSVFTIQAGSSSTGTPPSQFPSIFSGNKSTVPASGVNFNSRKRRKEARRWQKVSRKCTRNREKRRQRTLARSVTSPSTHLNAPLAVRPLGDYSGQLGATLAATLEDYRLLAELKLLHLALITFLRDSTDDESLARLLPPIEAAVRQALRQCALLKSRPPGELSQELILEAASFTLHYGRILTCLESGGPIRHHFANDPGRLSRPVAEYLIFGER